MPRPIFHARRVGIARASRPQTETQRRRGVLPAGDSPVASTRTRRLCVSVSTHVGRRNRGTATRDRTIAFGDEQIYRNRIFVRDDRTSDLLGYPDDQLVSFRLDSLMSRYTVAGSVDDRER